MVFLIAYPTGAVVIPQLDLTYSSVDSIVSTISDSLILGSTFGSLYSSMRFFCPASRCTVSSCTYIISQSKVHLHQWWNRKADNFRFSWAMIDNCCLCSGVPPGFLTTLQMSSAVLSMRTLFLSGLSSPFSLMSNLAASELKNRWMYIS